MIRARFARAFIVLLLGSAAAGVVVACSSDETTPAGSSGTTTTPPSTTTTVHVTAAAGGTVADPSGKTSLVIPPGALEKDTDITLALTPAASGAVVEVSELGPDGLKFLKPVALSIKADAALATAGKSLALAVLENGAFKAVEGSAYANGAATAPITHFSKYSIILVDGQVILQPPKDCNDALANFKPCGGDPKGTWTIKDLCIPGQSLGADPFGGKCPEFSADGDFTVTNELIIDATTITTTDGNLVQTSTLNIPLKCANSDGDGGTVTPAPYADCAAFQTQLNKNRSAKPQYACTDKGGGICACTVTETKANPGNKKTYTQNGNTITSTDSTGKVEAPTEYCVNNNLLTVAGKGGDGGIALLYSLQRK
jgi:hypothetical protein